MGFPHDLCVYPRVPTGGFLPSPGVPSRSPPALPPPETKVWRIPMWVLWRENVEEILRKWLKVFFSCFFYIQLFYMYIFFVRWKWRNIFFPTVSSIQYCEAKSDFTYRNVTLANDFAIVWPHRWMLSRAPTEPGFFLRSNADGLHVL